MPPEQTIAGPKFVSRRADSLPPRRPHQDGQQRPPHAHDGHNLSIQHQLLRSCIAAVYHPARRMVAIASAVAGGRTVRRPGQRRSPLPAVVERLPQGWTAPPTGCGKRQRRRRECPGRRPLRGTGCRSATGAGAFCWRCQSPGGLLSVLSIAGCVSGGILSVLTYSRPLCQAYAVGMPGSVASAHPSARG